MKGLTIVSMVLMLTTVSMTAFGFPVVPAVNISMVVSSSLISLTTSSSGADLIKSS